MYIPIYNSCAMPVKTELHMYTEISCHECQTQLLVCGAAPHSMQMHGYRLTSNTHALPPGPVSNSNHKLNCRVMSGVERRVYILTDCKDSSYSSCGSRPSIIKWVAKGSWSDVKHIHTYQYDHRLQPTVLHSLGYWSTLTNFAIAKHPGWINVSIINRL